MRLLPFAVTSILCLLFLIPLSLASGIGVSPSEVVYSDVLFGGYAERLVTVYNPDEHSMSYGISVEGQVSEWMSFDPGITFSVPPQGSLQLLFMIYPPDDITTGTYTGTATISSLETAQPKEGHGMGIKAGAKIPISISVTGQESTDYEVFPVTSDFMSGGSSSGSDFDFKFDIINKGNVEVVPHVHVDVWNRDQTRILKSMDFQGEDIMPTKHETQEFKLLTQNLDPGQYWADITVTIDGKVVRQDLLTFDVFSGEEMPVGEVIGVLHKPWVRPGEVMRVDFVFENKGLKTTTAVFRGNVYANEVDVGIVESEEVTVYPGESTNLTVFYKPQEKGQYVIRGKAYYSDKITYPVDAVINAGEVQETPEATGLFVDPTNFWAILAVIILIVYLAYRYKTR